jgi:L-rhamnose mutarotase
VSGALQKSIYNLRKSSGQIKAEVGPIGVEFLVLFCEKNRSINSGRERRSEVKRYAMVIRVRPEKLEEYRELHAAVWPKVLKKIQECHIQNYSIFLRDGYLFGYMEYTGSDFKADMEKMAADPKTQEWWKRTDPCQQPLESVAEGEWWAPMEEVFHCE